MWAAQLIEVGLSFLVISRLLSLRLHRVYGVFCAFLLADISGTLIWLADSYLHHSGVDVDYRLGWLPGKVAVWIFTYWTVYALLSAILANFRGILRFSRRLLSTSLVVCIAVGLASAVPEYWASGLSGPQTSADFLQKLVGMALIFDRVMCSAALLVLLVMLCLLLWFPVDVSRNLAVFTSGFVLYFAAKTALLLGRNFWSHDSTRIVSIAITAVLSLCLAYWAVFISAAGEHVRTRLGHRWQPREQERMIGQLEAMNAALLRVSQRKMPPQGVSR